MRIYTVHERPVVPGEAQDAALVDAVLVKEGFSWPAFLVAPLWALHHRQWLGLLAYAVAVTLLGLATEGAALGEASAAALALGFAILVGASANDWRRRTLAREGYRLAGVVVAPDLESAEERWFLGLAFGAGAARRATAPAPPPPPPPRSGPAPSGPAPTSST
ncbi:MAG: DUF2628 domain-containing protein [Alphaproteobacteria bacterium]